MPCHCSTTVHGFPTSQAERDYGGFALVPIVLWKVISYSLYSPQSVHSANIWSNSPIFFSHLNPRSSLPAYSLSSNPHPPHTDLSVPLQGDASSMCARGFSQGIQIMSLFAPRAQGLAATHLRFPMFSRSDSPTDTGGCLKCPRVLHPFAAGTNPSTPKIQQKWVFSDLSPSLSGPQYSPEIARLSTA